MNSIILDARSIAQLELEEYVRKQAAVIAPELEIDAVRDMDKGLLYRIWFGMSLLGTFYHDVDGGWIAQCVGESSATHCATSDKAQSFIVASSGLFS